MHYLFVLMIIITCVVEYVRADNPDIHTNSIEGRWFCVKRWLPSSGRYRLEEYLPVYQWKMYLRTVDEGPFWHLISLIANAEKNLFGIPVIMSTTEQEEQESAGDVSNTLAVETAVMDEPVPCLYCEILFPNFKSAMEHMVICKN